MRERHNRLVQLRRYGEPDEVKVVDGPLPEAGRSEVRVRVLAARAQAVVHRDEAVKVLRMLPLKYPEQKAPLPVPMPSPKDVRIFRVTPTVISVLDYSKGFGHTDLVTM
ncbi:MAG TPA: hypothetical protein VG758_24290 [Hyphomicrobiaceae bacterium]|nr:hypothetical protein [Hyphomicrobiaceae bacterium]